MISAGLLLFFIGPVVLIIIGALLYKHNFETDWQSILGIGFIMICSIILAGAIIGIISTNIIVTAFIINCKVYETMFPGSELQINDYHQLLTYQEYNKTIFDIFIPDEVEKLGAHE